MAVDDWRVAMELEPLPEAPSWSTSQLAAEEEYEETEPLDFDKELKALGLEPWIEPITAMSKLVKRLSTKEVLDRMKGFPVFAAQVYDLLHRALLRRRVKCHDCHMQKRAITMQHVPAVEMLDVLGYWERCMDKETGVMSDGPVHNSTRANQARMWVLGVYQFDKCVCRQQRVRYPHLVCCR